VPLRAAINEYIEVARLFFAQPEVAFVNAVLDRLAPRLRPPEPATPLPRPETGAPPA
jgi:transcription termination factor NusB